MKKITIFLLSVLFASVAQAADPPAQPKAVDTAPPPPAMDAAGVTAAPIEAESSVPTAPKNTLDAAGNEAPTVSVRKEGDDTIEEYRQSGNLTMIRISRKGGVPQTYIDTNGDGRLEINPKEGPVAPVYYTLYNWN